LAGSGKHLASDNERRENENAAIRLAFHTEVGMVALQCLRELEGWRAVLLSPGVQKDVRSAVMPPLTIYNSVSSNIGILSRDEIVSLVGSRGRCVTFETLLRKWHNKPRRNPCKISEP
jgi:hypothetical protein